jgi:hypothetical protein
MPKGQRTEVADTIEINGKQYATVRKAQEILSQLASELGTPHDYSRFAVFRLAVDNGIDILTTPSANYYSVEGLRGLKEKLRPGIGRGAKTGGSEKRTNYGEDLKIQAFLLQEQGLSNRQIAGRLGVSYQTINNWFKKHKVEEGK